MIRSAVVLILTLLIIIPMAGPTEAVPNARADCYDDCDDSMAQSVLACAITVFSPPVFSGCVTAAGIAWGACRLGCNSKHPAGLAYSPIPSAFYIDPPAGQPALFSFARVDTNGSVLTGQGSVVGVEISALPVAEIDTTIALRNHPFTVLGNATFNSVTNTWDYAIAPNLASLRSVAGSNQGGQALLVKASFSDPTDPLATGYAILAPPSQSPTIPSLNMVGIILLVSAVGLMGLLAARSSG